MKKFIVHLSRDYIVQIEAENEENARTYSEQYVTGGNNGSNRELCEKFNFEIHSIIPTSNESIYVEEIKP